MSVPRRVLVCGIAVVIRLTVPVDIAVIPLAAAARHFDDIRHCRASGFAIVGPAFAGIAAALRAREPSKVRTAIRILVVLPSCIAITMHAA